MSRRPIKVAGTASRAPGERPELPASTPAGAPPRAIVVRCEGGERPGQATARAVLRPTTGAAIATQAVYGTVIGGELLEVSGLADELLEQSRTAAHGDLARMESMLVVQAHTLDAMFNRLVQRAMSQDSLQHFETYMRLAMKAQAQTRATVVALAEIKNPRPIAYFRQANVGANVQVNNAAPYAPGFVPSRPREEPRFERTEVLERQDGERLDP